MGGWLEWVELVGMSAGGFGEWTGSLSGESNSRPAAHDWVKISRCCYSKTEVRGVGMGVNVITQENAALSVRNIIFYVYSCVVVS